MEERFSGIRTADLGDLAEITWFYSWDLEDLGYITYQKVFRHLNPTDFHWSEMPKSFKSLPVSHCVAVSHIGDADD